jgi:hypothetical protein
VKKSEGRDLIVTLAVEMLVPVGEEQPTARADRAMERRRAGARKGFLVMLTPCVL